MAADVQLVHVETGIHALVPERAVAGWERLGYARVEHHDDRRPPRAAATKRPASSPGISDDSTAGSSSTTIE